MSRQVLYTEYSREELKRIIKECLSETQKKPSQDKKVERLSQKEAAAFLGISVTTLISLKKQNKIPFHVVGGRIMFFKDEMLEATRGDPTLVKASRK